MNPVIIFDFDSTFIKDETLDEIAKYKSTLPGAPKNLDKKIIEITNLAMDGAIEFSTALNKRIDMLNLNKKDVIAITSILKSRISNSFLEYKDVIKSKSSDIYIISGGFKEIIYEVVKDFNIKETQIFANEFIYDGDIVCGIKKDNPLSRKDGKINALKQINLTYSAYAIGDGYTDFEMKQISKVKSFICYTENIQRPAVIEVADHIAPNLDSVFYYIKKLYIRIGDEE